MSKPCNKATDLSKMVYKFFGEYLIQQRRLSPHTIAAYRDSLRLYLMFTSKKLRRPVTRLCTNDLKYDTTLAFLQDLEEKRSNTVRTRNNRLAAIKCFLNYIGTYLPDAMEQASKVLAIPQKTWGRPLVTYLTRVEIEALLLAADSHSWSGQRDHTMLMLLYNTGARVSEVIQLKVQDIDLMHQHTVRFLGKGRKERIVPLWSNTMSSLIKWMSALPSKQLDSTLFPNRFGDMMTRSGVRQRLITLQKNAVKQCPSLAKKRVTPHTIRHTTAMHLLQSGVDLSLIALWLGHEQLETTHQYMSADLQLKQATLASLAPIDIKGQKSPKMYPDSVLTYLESL